jgi:2-C-methyl-D-erythritol 4-phosphate cytidylyltransferase
MKVSDEVLHSKTGRGDCIAIVPAAGSSSRFGPGTRKVFAEVGGVAVLRRSVEVLSSVSMIRHIVVLARPDEVDEVAELLSGLSNVTIAIGGPTRQQSVANGLAHALARCGLAGDEFVIVHDAARCLVTKTVIERALISARECGAVTTAVPVVDTISVREVPAAHSSDQSSNLISTLDRKSLVAIQTPQVFRAELLLRAHEAYGEAPGVGEATDDAMLVKRIAQVRIVEGDPRNIKVTRPFDIAVAEALLKSDCKE